MHDMLEQGRVKKAKDLEELSQMTGMPLDHLKASIEEYNRAARHEVEADKFGFKATHTDDRPMTEGPWYFAKKVPTIHHTMGGIKIDTNAHVLNAKGQWIKGLYAAGETTGGVHGENRLGGNAECVVWQAATELFAIIGWQPETDSLLYRPEARTAHTCGFRLQALFLGTGERFLNRIRSFAWPAPSATSSRLNGPDPHRRSPSRLVR